MFRIVLICSAFLPLTSLAEPFAMPDKAAIDARVAQAMAHSQAKGLSISVIEGGRVRYTQSYGVRNAAGAPLTTDTIMYGASLTKTVFAFTALQLVDRSLLKLDEPIAKYLSKPLPDYPAGNKHPDWSPLKTDDRWQEITPRHILTHSTGFANFGFLEPDKKLHIHFKPGSRYAYSGDGILLLQFAIEEGLVLDVGKLTQENFDRLGMSRTSLIWRSDFRENLADGWTDNGEVVPHDERSRVRAAGSMDTTISDLARFFAALLRGSGIKSETRAEMTRPQLHITTAHQFPTFLPELPAEKQRKDLFAGLGVVVFDGPQGHGFFKGGHNECTANTFVGLENGQRGVLILSNDVRAEAEFAELVRFILGETGVPYDWEYGDRAGKS